MNIIDIGKKLSFILRSRPGTERLFLTHKNILRDKKRHNRNGQQAQKRRQNNTL